MKFLSETFNNRELAIILWFSVIFIWSISKQNIRGSYKQILKVFFNKKIIIPVLFMLFYVYGITIVLFLMNIWDLSILKDTIIWTFSTGFVLFFNLTKAKEDENFFKKMILGNLKVVVLLEFILNLYVFNFWIELILVLIISFVGIAEALTEKGSSYKQVNNLFNSLLGIYFLSIFIFSIYSITKDLSGFASYENLKSFLLPPVYFILYLPFIYIMVLYLIYELIFVRLTLYNDEKELIKHARRKLIIKYHLNLKRLIRWFKKTGSMHVNNKEDVLNLIRYRKQ